MTHPGDETHPVLPGATPPVKRKPASRRVNSKENPKCKSPDAIGGNKMKSRIQEPLVAPFQCRSLF
ncbi:hypothetical protein BC567DRAFT_215563 [Phyllosticta citribraziliensis]